MNNEMRDKVIKIVTDVYDRQAQICDSADEIIDLVEAALTQQREAEPAVYQSRMRPEFDRYHAWTPWENCSKGKYEDIKRVPVNAGWIFEARALYLHPPKPAAQQQVPEGMLRVELAMSDRSISRLIHVAQIETSNTNEVERYANQCWRELSAAKEEG